MWWPDTAKPRRAAGIENQPTKGQRNHGAHRQPARWQADMINGFLSRGRLYCEDCTTGLRFCAAVRLCPAQTTECAECRAETTGKDDTVVLPSNQENPTYGDLSAADALSRLC
jgi:hypothetical protein